MINIRKEILDQIDAFLGKGLATKSNLGRTVCNDAMLINRIRSGGNVGITTIQKLFNLMTSIENDNNATAPGGELETKE